MKKQIVKEFVTVKYVRFLPKPEPTPPPPPPRRVLIIGQSTVDLIAVVDTFPEEGGFERTEEGYWKRGGSGSNICTVLRRLGHRCEFMGNLSRLPTFESLLFDFMSSGIEIKNCPRVNYPPTHNLVLLTRDKKTSTTTSLINPKMELSFQGFLGGCDFKQYSWIHFEARNARETYRMINAVREYNERADDNIIISVDCRELFKQNLTLADLADYVFIRRKIQKNESWMNGHEACRIMREKLNLRRAQRNKMLKKKNPYITTDPLPEEVCNPPKERIPVIICPHSLEGACAVDDKDRFIKVAGHQPMQIVETLAENDTFIASFIYAMDNLKLSLRDSLEYGTRVASFKISVMGLDRLRCVPKDLTSFYYM